MDFLSLVTDDQLALLGCGAAFFFFAAMMALSHSLRNSSRADQPSVPVEPNRELGTRPVPLLEENDQRAA
ncbi:MAG: hypothetical protein IID45_07860 [Planctomycetes bacterium]|nr:hypothetical protein [Planctomycetota bacterium]